MASSDKTAMGSAWKAALKVHLLCLIISWEILCAMAEFTGGWRNRDFSKQGAAPSCKVLRDWNLNLHFSLRVDAEWCAPLCKVCKLMFLLLGFEILQCFTLIFQNTWLCLSVHKEDYLELLDRILLASFLNIRTSFSFCKLDLSHDRKQQCISGKAPVSTSI